MGFSGQIGRTGLILAAAGMAGAVLGISCAAKPPALAARATADENFNAAWDAALEVLAEYRFEIDRADRRAGVITTFPMVGRHWFEFWRLDAATPADVAEGTLQTIYRQATVTIHLAAPGGSTTRPTTLPAPARAPGAAAEYYVTVEVRTSRSDRPAPEVTSTSEAYEMFTGAVHLQRTAVTTTQPDRQPRYGVEAERQISAVTVDLGRDANLEAILQRRINSRAAKTLTLYPR
jgi:hypothetical protein